MSCRRLWVMTHKVLVLWTRTCHAIRIQLYNNTTRNCTIVPVVNYSKLSKISALLLSFSDTPWVDHCKRSWCGGGVRWVGV